MCGGTALLVELASEAEGLSPRVRGNRAYHTLEDVRHRSIPACAGEPTVLLRSDGGEEVYPRVCGGT